MDHVIMSEYAAMPPTPTYAVNRALGRWTDPGPMSAFATRDPIHIVHSTLRINPNMFMFMFMSARTSTAS